MKAASRFTLDRVSLLAAPAMLYMGLVFALPVALLILRSFDGPAGPSLSAYVSFLSDSFNWRVIGNTLRVATLGCQRIPKSTRTAEEILEYCGVGAAQIADHAMALLKWPR